MPHPAATSGTVTSGDPSAFVAPEWNTREESRTRVSSWQSVGPIGILALAHRAHRCFGQSSLRGQLCAY